MDRMTEKWFRLLEAREHLIQICEEIDQNLNKNRLVRRHWNEKTSEWMERFKQIPSVDSNERAR
jgi:LPS sulfotransferase NodH